MDCTQRCRLQLPPRLSPPFLTSLTCYDEALLLDMQLKSTARPGTIVGNKVSNLANERLVPYVIFVDFDHVSCLS